MNYYLQQSAVKNNLKPKKEVVLQVLLSTTFRTVLFSLLIAFSVLYLVKTTTVSTKGYEISNLEKQVDELSIANKKIDVEIAKNSSMNSIQERLKELNFVAVDQVEYLKIKDNVMAKR